MLVRRPADVLLLHDFFALSGFAFRTRKGGLRIQSLDAETIKFPNSSRLSSESGMPLMKLAT